MHEIDRLRGIGRIGATILIGLTLKGDVSIPALTTHLSVDSTANSLNIQPDIQLVSQQEAYKALGIPLAENPAPPSAGQLYMLISALSDMPSELVGPQNGKKLKIFIGDLPSSCSCDATTYSGGAYIGISRDILNTTNEEGYRPIVTRVVAHELTHRKYFETDPIQIDNEVLSLLGNQEDVRRKLLEHPSDGSPNAVLAVDAVYSLLNDGGRRILPEGIARLSEFFVSGPDVFNISLSPYIDSEAFYKYWDKTFFSGIQYNSNLKPIYPTRE